MTIFHRSLSSNLRMMIFFVTSAAIPAFSAVLLLSIYQLSGGHFFILDPPYEGIIIVVFLVAPLSLISAFLGRRYYKFNFSEKPIKVDYFIIVSIWFFLMLIFLKVFISIRDSIFEFDVVNPITLVFVFLVAMLFGLLELVVVRRSPRREDIR